jgi:hypothetical protein
MRSDYQARPWRELTLPDRAARIVLLLGLASFIAFWLISVWLESAASHQPAIATGLYQHPYLHKGRVNYLTDGQARIACIGRALAFGWGAAAIAAIWIKIGDARAGRMR